MAHYKTFGFLALREAFNPDEVAAFGQAFDELLERDRQGLPFSGEKRQTLFGIAEQHPLLTQLVEDDRIYQTVEQLLGPGFSWLCSEGNLYIGDTPWHPDGGSNSDFPFMKVSLYLDPLAWDTGCLRVIPGSHRLPFHQELRNLTDRQGEVDTAAAKIDIAGPEVPCFPLPAQPGDVFFLDMNMWHASFGGKAGRRHRHMLRSAVLASSVVSVYGQRFTFQQVGLGQHPQDPGEDLQVHLYRQPLADARQGSSDPGCSGSGRSPGRGAVPGNRTRASR